MTRRNSYELSPGKGPSIWRTLEDKNRAEDELNELAEEEQPGGFITDLLRWLRAFKAACAGRKTRSCPTARLPSTWFPALRLTSQR